MKYLISITQQELKNQLNYDPLTGIFTRLVSNSNRVKVGSIAGMQDDMGYIRIKIHGTRYKAHRLAWLYVNGEFPEELIDHVNGIKNDNRICNLREANRSENNKNCKIRKDNVSGYKGVWFSTDIQKYCASISDNNVVYRLGTFDTPEEASDVYEAKAKIMFGDFYRDTRNQIKTVD